MAFGGNTGPFNVNAAGLRNPLLNPNEVYASIFNMIISQTVFDPKIEQNYNFVDRFKTDGSLYGDTKLFYEGQELTSRPWGGHTQTEANNLLTLVRAKDPMCQEVTIDTFRRITLTTDSYLTKRAWSTEGAFSQFNSIMVGMMAKTKKLYENRLLSTFIGTTVSKANKAVVSVDVTTAAGSASTEEEARKLTAMQIGQDFADLLVDMKDTTKDYNDYKFLRSYDTSDLYFIWNAKWYNKIIKTELPLFYERSGIVDKMNEDIMPARYFGTVITSTNASSYSDATPTTGKPINSSTGAYTPGSNNANGCIRSLVEQDVTVSEVDYHVFPGDELPAGATIGSSKDFAYGDVYIEEGDVICKIVSKDAVPFMSAFSTNTSFFNPSSLTTTEFTTWGYSNPVYLFGKAFITVKAV